tara:strand:- start:84 stop:260 length:177 start_codon:yes stop_codon:yes gene_type:complete
MPHEDDSDWGIIDTAGTWVEGVGTGIVKVFVPVMVFSFMVGFMLRLSKMGMRIGRGEA